MQSVDSAMMLLSIVVVELTVVDNVVDKQEEEEVDCRDCTGLEH